MNFKLLFTLILALVVTTAESFTLNVSLPKGIPALNFSYAVSTGSCSNPNSVNCHFTQSKVDGIAGAHITQYLTAVNAEFKTMTPVVDKLHTTNFIEMKIPGQSGVCHIDLLGKKVNSVISVILNKTGICIVK